MSGSHAIVVALLVGVAGSSAVHLSKGIMKEGVARRRALLYAAGVALNFTAPLWVIVANRFAPTVYYTSVYGLGLVALVLYGRLRLGEALVLRQLAGLLLIVAGTLVIGLAELTQPQPSLHGASREILFAVAGVWIVGTPVAALVLRRAGSAVQEVVFGVFGGGFAALDAVAKGAAQAGESGSTLLPAGAANWLLFALSFLGAAGAFGMIQWSYVRRCRASMMGASYDVAYVSVPLLLIPVLVGRPVIGLWCVVGIVCLGFGAALTARRATTSAGEPAEDSKR